MSTRGGNRSGQPGAARRGAALIIAIVVLAALLMLGLPFLFTQSSSLSGTRSFAHSQSAYINRDAAENVGVAAGTLVIKNSLKGTTGYNGTEQWSSMVDKLIGLKGLPLTPAMPLGWAVALGDNRVGINMGTMPGFNGTPMSAGAPGQGRGLQQSDIRNTGIIGTAIEDEAGKLDVNSLTVAGWDALLKQVGIDDWDDQQAANSRPVLQPNGGYWGIDDDNYGELARALAESRLNLPGRRYVRFEQLLLADTHNWSGTAGGGQYGLRRPLTRSELDLLLPYLTLHNPSQGRGSADPNASPPPFGLGKEAIIDLGTIVQSDAPDWANGYTRVYYIDSQAASNFDHSSPLMISQSQPTVVGMGTWVITDQVDPQKGPDRGIVHQRFSKFPLVSTSPAKGVPQPTGQTTLRIQATWNYVDYNTPLYPNAGAAGAGTFAGVAIEAPPAVNINDAPVFVRALYGFQAKTVLPKPFTTQDALRQPTAQSLLVSNPFLQQQVVHNSASPAAYNYLYAFNLQNPLASSYIPSTNVQALIDKRMTELPPLAISSPGIFSIISSAAVLDGQGNQGAQEMRRAVVQALPQEQVSERRWITQGQFYGLVSQRYGSGVETWPNATRRLQQNPQEPLAFPDDPDLSVGGSPAAQTGLKPAVQPNESTGFSNRTDSVIPPDASFTTMFPPPPTTIVGQGKPQHFLINPAFSIDWRMPLGLDVATDSSNNHLFIEKESGSPNPAAVVGGTSYTASDLHPDGLLLKSGAPLAMEINDDLSNIHGLLRRTLFGVQSATEQMPRWEINGRHLSLWVTPQNDWTTGIIPLLEARTPQSQVCGPITLGGVAGASGNNDLQNYLGLFFDAPNRLIVLVFAPPAIEHLADYGLNIPSDDTTVAFNIDARCYGSDFSMTKDSKIVTKLLPLAPAQVRDAAPGGTSAKLASVTPLFKPNRIVHCYKVPDRTVGGVTTPYFHQNQAVHIQLALANDRPGSSAIIIDGCAGRDVSRDISTNGMMTKLGDHCALPAMTMSSAALPATNPAMESALSEFSGKPSTITVNPVAGLNAEDLFPQRGMIKIDDEYISYQSVSGNTFSGCVRGQRQNTNTSLGNAASWPILEAHATGSYVCPGGYRITLGNVTLYSRVPTTPALNPPMASPPIYLFTGSCTTGDHVDNGWDPKGAPPSGLDWRIWSRVDPKKIPPIQVDPTDPSGNTLVLFPNNVATDIPLDQTPLPTNGVLFPQWPKRGLILIGNQVLFYSNPGAGTSLGGVTAALTTGWNFNPSLVPQHVAMPVPLAAIRWNKNNPAPMVRLLSLEIVPTDGADPTQRGKFFPSMNPVEMLTGNSDDRAMFEIMHPSGRVEWIRYSHTAVSPGGGQGYYFMWWLPPGSGDIGFGPTSRGAMRTDFAGREAVPPSMLTYTKSNLDPVNDTFPAGSKVLPVQVETAPAGHFLATGDVITILPKNQMTTGGTPGTGGNIPNQVQAVIRYAAMDGYAASQDPNNTVNDVRNEWFAFNDPLLPAFWNFDITGFEFLCWPGWSGNDLTSGPLGNGPLSNIQLPHGYLPRIDMLAQGFNATAGTGNARTFFLSCDQQRGGTNGGVMATANASIDGIVAGPLPAASALTVGAIASWVAAPGGAVQANGLAASGGMGSTAVTTAENAFVTPMGLIMIGGEVFAFARDDNQFGNIVNANTKAATLVGRGLLGSTPVAHNGQEFYTILPLGPVARLDQTLPQAGGFFQVYDQLPQGGQPRYVTFDAPMMMLMDPAGTAAGGGQAKLELVPVIGPRLETNPPGITNSAVLPWYLTAPWLRGMYNTVQQSWSGGGAGQAPIALGWWPRYPSALPQSGATPQHYRSRSYGWIGFPLSLVDARFDPAVFGSDPVATVSVLDTQTSGLFSIEARALSTGFDWSLAPAATLTNSAMPDQDVTAAFKQRAFANTAVNGAELRVLWRYASAPSNDFSAISAACNSAPMIGPVRLRALAPAKVLSVESAR